MSHDQLLIVKCFAIVSLFAISFSVNAQVNEREVFNISSDYDLLIKKIERQTLHTGMSEFDMFLSDINKVKEENRISVNLPHPLREERLPEEIYQLRSRGVLMVGNFYDCGKCDKMHTAINATAVVLTEEGLCVTNHHVFKSTGLGGMADTPFLKKHVYISDIDGNIFPIQEILTYSETGDVAIFKINPKDIKLSPIPFGENAMVASTVHAISHPKGKELYYYSKGTVARNTFDAKDPLMDRMYVSCEYAVGSSGGPILDNKGNLVGIVSTTRPLYTSAREPMHLQMLLRGIVPVKTIKALIN